MRLFPSNQLGWSWRSVLAIAVTAAVPHVAGAQSATLQGTVREQGTSRPLEAVQVFVVGSSAGAVSNAQGEYRIVVPNISAAHRIEVRARMIGFTQVTRGVEVGPNRTSTLDFVLGRSPLQLDEVVVTGTGGATEVKKLGNTIAIVKPPEDMPIADVSSLLQGREPGLVGLPSGGLTGEGTKIRIRGNASLSQSNEPIVFVDGVRINSGGGQAANGNIGSSRLDDFDPSTIDRVEVLKGAAAATLYGTEASNGVIQIFTKKGAVGAPRWTVSYQGEMISMPDQVAPNSFYVKDVTTANNIAPIIGFTPTPYQVYEIPIFKDFLTEQGTSSVLTAQVQGGSPTVQYFISARNQNEDGPFGNKTFGPADDLARRQQATISLQLIPTSKLRIGTRNSYANTFLRSPEANNNIYGANSLAYMARPEFANCAASSVAAGQTFKCTAAGNPFGNQAFMTIRESMQQLNDHRVGRYTGALDVQYQWTAGFGSSISGGYDFTSQRDIGFSPFGYNVDLFTAQTPDGSRGVREERQGVITVHAQSSWNRAVTSNLQSSFVAGLQVFNEQRTVAVANGTNFPGPGIEVVGAAGLNQTVGESFLTTINGGYFGQEQLSFRDFLHATFGGRYDFSSAFGAEAPGVFYPKVSLSYVASEQSWFQSTMPRWFSTLRLRSAWGQSGRQPGAFDKFTTFGPLSSELGAGLVPSNLGNPALKPEVSTETELGFEAAFLDNRAALEFTAWNRKVDDLLVARLYPPSGGFRNTQLSNIGSMKANGLELGLRVFPIQRSNLTTEVFASAANLKQTLTSLGGAPPLKVGYFRYRGFLKEGYPLGSLFSPRLAEICPAGGPRKNKAGTNINCYDPAAQLPIDFNGQGSAATTAQLLTYFATPRDLKSSAVQSALRPYLADYDGNGNTGEQFVGDIIPDWTGSYGFNMSFFGNWRLSSLFEFKTGFLIQNLTDGFRMSQHPSIGSNRKEWSRIESIMNNPASTPNDRLEAAKEYVFKYRRLLEPGLHQHEPGDFTRWRELSLTWLVPESMARKAGARTLSVTAAGRNLLLWTKYSGLDPEANAIGRGAGSTLDQNFLDSTDAFGIPIPRRFSLTINYGF